MCRRVEVLISMIVNSLIALALLYITLLRNDPNTTVLQDPIEHWIALGVVALLLDAVMRALSKRDIVAELDSLITRRLMELRPVEHHGPSSADTVSSPAVPAILSRQDSKRR